MPPKPAPQAGGCCLKVRKSSSTVTVFPGVLADSGVRMASDMGIAAFKRLGCRGDRARTSRDLPSVPLDTRQETEAEIATGKLRCLEYTGSLENSEILPLPRQKQAEKLLQ